GGGGGVGGGGGGGPCRRAIQPPASGGDADRRTACSPSNRSSTSLAADSLRSRAGPISRIGSPTSAQDYHRMRVAADPPWQEGRRLLPPGRRPLRAAPIGVPPPRSGRPPE